MFKNKRWICNFIALIILISGMCVDEVKADSVFLCLQSVGAVAGTPDSIISEVDDMQETEILCTRNTSTSRQVVAQIISSRKSIKFQMALVCMTVLLLLFSHFYTTGRVIEFAQSNARVVVLNYIHSMDGKK